VSVLSFPGLLISDGRFPGGGHAHSGGLEAAVSDGSIDPAALFPTFSSFVAGRLGTAGAIDAWLAACACRGGDEEQLDAEADARCPSPALRLASRRLGRGLRRAAARSFPALVGGPGEHQAVVVGVVSRAAGLSPDDAARVAVHHLLAGAVSAAVRLLPIDAADAMAVAMGLAPLAESVAAAGCAAALGPMAGGPAWSAPLVELRAEDHARWEVRLFAS
jgi:urease accessory protein